MTQPRAATLRPPGVTPARQPLRFPANLVKLISNNLEIVPAQAYREDVVVAPGPPRMAFITGPEAVETVLKERAGDFPKGRLQNDVLDPLFGDAMISSEGPDWRWQRRVAAPLFRHEELLDYVPIMRGAAETTVEAWRRTAVDGGARVINRDMMQAAFGVISRTMLAGGADEVIDAIEKGHAAYFRRVNWWVLYCMLGLPHWLPRPGGRVMRRQERALRAAVHALVQGRREAAESEDLLGRLLAARDPETGEAMDRERLVNNIIAFLVAGYDTTALALSWALYLIAQSPEWEERMREEVIAVAGDGPIEAQHLDRLVVVEQVVNETLRLYPTAPIIVRDIDQRIDLGGVPVPAGTIGLIPIYAIHRHHRLWREPERFDPGRFAPDAPARPGRYQFLPFGAGPRICIGAAFAVMEAKVMLATFVRAARFTLCPGFVARPTGQMFLTAAEGIPMRVTPRR